MLMKQLLESLHCFTSLLSSVCLFIPDDKDRFLKSCCEEFLEKPMRREFLLDVAMFRSHRLGVTPVVEVVQLLNKKRLASRLAVTTSALACLNFSMVFPAASTAASPAFANLFTHNGSFWTPSRSHKASQKWLQLRESGS